MRLAIVLTFLVISLNISGQSISALDVVKNSISFHDPHHRWKDFQDTLFLIQISPDNTRLKRTVYIDRPNDIFAYQFEKRDGTIQLHLENGQSVYKWNEHPDIPGEIIDKYQLTAQRAQLYKNYYRYLYGLPMKILDPGAQLHPEVKRVQFKEMDVLRVKLSYDPEVGDDIWYFYFDPGNFKLRAYQFFHDESKNDGEYILLYEHALVSGIRMPKIRVWFRNATDEILGTDVIDIDGSGNQRN